MAKLKKVDDELEARRCLAEAKSARQSPGEWARAHGIDGRSLNAWRVNLSRRGSSSRGSRSKRTSAAVQRPGLVELVPTSVGTAASRYVVRIGVATLEFGADFDETALRRAVSHQRRRDDRA